MQDRTFKVRTSTHLRPKISPRLIPITAARRKAVLTGSMPSSSCRIAAISAGSRIDGSIVLFRTCLTLATFLNGRRKLEHVEPASVDQAWTPAVRIGKTQWQ